LELDKREDFAQVQKDSEEDRLFQEIADFIVELLYSAGGVRLSWEVCWSLHYNALLGRIFGPTSPSGEVSKIIKRYVRQKIYKATLELETFPEDAKTARILAVVLNVLGISTFRFDRRTNIDSYALYRPLRAWMQRNFAKVAQRAPKNVERFFVAKYH